MIVSAPGYKTETTEIHSSFSAVTIIDLIFIIPWAVDLADGAAYTLSPESVQMQLEPIVAASAPPPPSLGAAQPSVASSASQTIVGPASQSSTSEGQPKAAPSGGETE